ncbi:MAG: FtsB family cell division protein [Endomicrobiia bacterium]
MKRKKYDIALPEIDFLKIAIFVVLGFFIYFFISNCIVKYLILKNKCDILKTKLEKLKQENKKLLETVYLLENDTDTIEYYIRKELNYKKQGEKVIIFNNK